MLPNILPLAPYLRETIWGGRGLETHYRKDLPPDCPIGESWEVSAYQDMESTVSEGPLKGQTLLNLVLAHGPELLGQTVYNRYNGEFPLLIKLLDAHDDLSIQVHPDDHYTQAQNLGTFGKMEAWYVLYSDHGQIAYDLKEGTTKSDFESAIRENRVGDAVRFFEVQPGDVVYMPPGTVHALCKNVIVYEVQQSSDLTFRIYDYNRPGTDGHLRELHIDQALDVIAFETSPSEVQSGSSQTGVLVESEHFRLERFAPTDALDHTYDSFAALTCLRGNIQIKSEESDCAAQKGDTFLIPANRPFTTTPQTNNTPEYLISSVPMIS